MSTAIVILVFSSTVWGRLPKVVKFLLISRAINFIIIGKQIQNPFYCSTTHLCIGKKIKLDTVRVPVNFYNPWTDLSNIMIRIVIHSFDSENNLVDFCNIKM